MELKARLDLIARQAADLQESSQRIVAAEDEERQRLSRDLHDGIQQQLVVLRMQVGMLQDGIGPGADDPPRAYDSLGGELDRVIEQLREVTHNLYPSILVDRGLTAALHSYVGRLPLTTVVSCQPEDFPRLAPEIESGAYFLLGEAVTNALKHARATRIDIGLRLTDGWLEVTVADDGVGFDPDQTGSAGRAPPHGGPRPLLRRPAHHRLPARRRHPGGGDFPPGGRRRRGHNRLRLFPPPGERWGSGRPTTTTSNTGAASR